MILGDVKILEVASGGASHHLWITRFGRGYELAVSMITERLNLGVN
jgi:hypothetical protein